MTEIVRYSKVGLQDLNLGENTFEVTLADGRVVTMDQISLNTLNDLSPLLVTAVNTVTPVNSLTARSLPERFADWYNVKDYGAVGNGSTDDTAAIQAAITAAGVGGGTVWLPAGEYLVTSTLLMNKSGVNLRGDSMYTYIDFEPTADDICLHLGLGVSFSILFCHISDVRFYSDDSAFAKTAICFENARQCSIQRVFVNGSPVIAGGTYWTGGAGLGSTGIQTKGHEFSQIRDVAIQADTPLRISADTLTPAQGIDHFTFDNCYLVSNTTHACVVIDSGVVVSSTRFIGSHPWVKGKYGLYWVDTVATSVSQGITFEGVRTEQSTDVTGYSFYIDHNFGIQGLTFTNCRLDITTNGFFLRKTQVVTIDTCNAPTTLIGMNAVANANGHTIDIRNSYFDSATTMTFSGYRQIFGTNKPTAAGLITRSAYYTYDNVGSSPNTTHRIETNVYVAKFTASVASGGTLNLEVGPAAGYTHAQITVTAHGLTRDEGMVAMWTTNSVGFKIAGTANTAITNVASNLCLFSSGSQPRVLNNLGETVAVIAICYATRL